MTVRRIASEGYGIETTCLHVDDVKRVEDLIALDPVFRKETQEILEDHGVTTPSIKDYYETYDESVMGIALILADVISAKEHIDLTPCEALNGQTYLIYKACLPWEISQEEKTLTRDALDNIFRKYAAMVCDDDIEPEYKIIL